MMTMKRARLKRKITIRKRYKLAQSSRRTQLVWLKIFSPKTNKMQIKNKMQTVKQLKRTKQVSKRLMRIRRAYLRRMLKTRKVT